MNHWYIQTINRGDKIDMVYYYEDVGSKVFYQ